MRKIADSSNTVWMVRFSSRADAQVAPERLLDDETGVLRAARAGQPLHDDRGTGWAGSPGSTSAAWRRPARGRWPHRWSRLVVFARDVAQARAAAPAAPCDRRAGRARATLSATRARNCFSVHFVRATPMTGMFSRPRRSIAASAGKIILYARSPLAPNSTSPSDCATPIPTVSRHEGTDVNAAGRARIGRLPVWTSAQGSPGCTPDACPGRRRRTGSVRPDRRCPDRRGTSGHLREGRRGRAASGRHDRPTIWCWRTCAFRTSTG